MSLNSERFPLTSGLRNKHSENDGFKVILVSFIVFSIAITVALIVQIHYGQPEVAPHAAVSSDHKNCSTLGTEAIRRGGTAVDAAVSVALCMSVVHPHNSGLGGGGFMLIHDHADNRSWVIDFRESAPDATNPGSNVSSTGARSVAVPGLMRGLELAHSLHGKLGWGELIRPSALMARTGVRVTEQLAAALRNHLSVATASASPALSVFVGDDGQLLRAGDQLIMTDLADTLDHVQMRGADAIYEGPLAASMVNELSAVGGVITSADLSTYEPLKYEGLLRDFGEYSVLTTAAPSGGPALVAALELAARANLSEAPTAALHYHRITEALRLSMARFSQLGDPGTNDNVTVAVESLLSPASLDALSQEMSDTGMAADSPLPALDTPAATHISVIDDNELYVSLVSGLGSYFGSKVRSATGIILNNAMAAFYSPDMVSNGTMNVPAPGRRSLTTQTPAILMSSKVCGRRVVTGGSDASLLAQAVLRLTDPVIHDNLTSSLEGPRIHVDQDSVQLGLEVDRLLQLPATAVAALKAIGHTTAQERRPYPSCNGITKYFDQLSSHADSRGGGTAVRF